MSWQQVDKLAGETFKKGLFKSEPGNPCYKTVDSISFDGKIRKYPFTHEEWLEYSNKLLIEFDEIWRDEKIPIWENLNFRSENNFRAGIWGGFCQIWLIFINCLPSEKSKFIAYKHITDGICIFDNQAHIPEKSAKQFKRNRKIYHLATSSFKNEHYANWHRKLLNDSKKYIDIAGHKLSLTSHYPIKVTKINGQLTKLPFLQENSNHLLDNIKVINDQLISWIKTGAVEFLGDMRSVKSKLRTSLVLVYNVTNDKFRTCFDGGSFKTTQSYSVPCRLDTLCETLLFINKNDYLSKFDDSSGFLQSYLDESSRNMTHFRWGNYIFRFFAAAFGIARVPSDFQLLNNCAISFLRRHGIPVSLYLDDRLVVEKNITRKEIDLINEGKLAPKNAYLTCNAMIAAGGFISRKKSTFKCSRQINFLGFDICTETETISIPEGKWEKFQKEIEIIMKSTTFETKELERLRGKMCSFLLVIRNMRLYIRRITEKLVEAEKSNNKYSKMDDRLLSELKIWSDKTMKNIKTTRSWYNKLSHTVELQRYKVSTDASNMAGGWVDHEGSERTFYWKEKDQAKHINLKEAIAIKEYIITKGEDLRNKRIMFLCDNMVVVNTFHNGSKVPELNDEILEINHLAIKLNGVFTIQHVTTDIQEADEASRIIDLKEEIVSDDTWKLIVKFFGNPTIDCMANFTNTRCDKYFSRFKEAQAIATNFLSQIPNENERLYCFPPKVLAHIAAKHLYDLDLDFILIFHVFSELPYFVAHRPINSKLIRIDDKVKIASLIPCKKIYNNSFLQPNNKSGALFAISYIKQSQ